MEHDRHALKLPDLINLLKAQQEQLHLSLGELFEDAAPWAASTSPELILELRRLSETTETVLDQITRAAAELDRMEKVGADEFVKNYAVKPGSKA